MIQIAMIALAVIIWGDGRTLILILAVTRLAAII